MIFGFSILVTALLLSMVAAYYSVAGLTAIFSAAIIPVVIMGASLELGKIVATVWLHNNWKRAGIIFKMYLIPAVAFLMLLTSMGIFGYLSKAHSDQSLVSGDSIAKVAIYDEKIKISKENIDAGRKALKQMDESVDQVMGRSSDEKGADKAVALRRGQQKERGRILAEIEAEQKKISSLNEERAPLAAEFRKVEAEVGPIKYIAALVYGDNPDANVLERAVRLVIIMIVLVFDPLALTLILAANKQFEWARAGTGGFVHDEETDEKAHKRIEQELTETMQDLGIVAEPKYEADDGPLTVEQVDQLKESVESFRADPHPPGWMYQDLAIAPHLEEKDIEEIIEEFDNIKHRSAEIDDAVLQAYNDERLVSQFDKQQLAEDDDDSVKLAIKQWKNDNPEDTIKNQRYQLMRGEIEELPWMRLVADNALGEQTHTGFGSVFPINPARGDTFIRISQMPSLLYKFNGNSWIQVDKNLSDSYTYDSAYIEHLINKISTGEYDIDLMSDSERQQVEQHLQNKAS